jgi:uncharacterized membrane-anchored protein YjiN (DUF445 family)
MEMVSPMKFTEDLVEKLQDKEFAVEYIHEIISEFSKASRRETVLADVLKEIHSNATQHLSNDAQLSSAWLVGLIDQAFERIGQV